MSYVADKLDQENLDEILAMVRASLRSGRLDSHPREVEYLHWVLNLRDFDTFKAERDSVYREYDDYCDRLVGILESSEHLDHPARLQRLGPHFVKLFYLDGKRRGLGGAFNDPDSLARYSEGRFQAFVETYLSPEEATGLVREVVVNALAPELPFDVQTTEALLSVIIRLDLTGDDFQIERLVSALRANLADFGADIERYARGSIVTFARKLMKYAKVRTEAAAHLAQIERSREVGLRRKDAALRRLREAIPNERHVELAEHVRVVTGIARCNGIEDVQRRVALDRFEEYLLRRFVTESMFQLGLIDSPQPFQHDQPELVDLLEQCGGEYEVHR
jgi:hypothetical protein